jgi:hypothetical protein
VCQTEQWKRRQTVVVFVVEHVVGVVQEEVAHQEVVGVLVMVCEEGKLFFIILFLIIN